MAMNTVASLPSKSLFLINTRLDQFARDRKVEYPLGHTCGGGLMRSAATTLISRSTLVCRNLGNFVLCVNLTTNWGELNGRKETGVTPRLFSSSLRR